MKKFKLLLALIIISFSLPEPCLPYTVDYILDLVRQKKLPEVCAYMGVLHAGRTKKGRKLKEKYGPDWNHMHHYCWALVDLKNGNDGQALRNLDYVLRNTQRNFVLRPIVLIQKASILMIKKRYQEAMVVYREMIEERPDLEEGWVGMANTLALLGEYKKTKKIAQQGLKHVPGSKNLRVILNSQK